MATAACTKPAPAPTDLILAFARDSMPVDSLTGWPNDSVMDALLDRIGIPHDATAHADSVCVLGGDEKPAPPLQRMTCPMQGNRDAITIELKNGSEGPELRVYRPGDTTAQTSHKIPLDEMERFDTRHPYIFATDVDGDGIREMLIRQFMGGTGNTQYDVWRYQSTGSPLARDSILSATPNLYKWPGRPCLHNGWHMGGADRASGIQCLRNNKWTDVWMRSEAYDEPSKKVIRHITVMVRDSMRLVRTDTLPEQ